MNEPNAKIGPYRLLGSLGRGGMGMVHRAVHVDSGKTVALKTVHAPREGLLRGLRREIQALTRLVHPGIVRVLDEGLHDGNHWYAMELLEGTTLRAWSHCADAGPDEESSDWWTYSLVPIGGQPGGLSRRSDGQRPASESSQDVAEFVSQTSQTSPVQEAKPLVASTSARIHGARDEREASIGAVDGESLEVKVVPQNPASYIDGRLAEILSVMRSLCAPLAYLHGEGIVHRDLKPENILIRLTSGTGGTPRAHRPDSTRFPPHTPQTVGTAIPVIVDFGLATQFAGSIGREALDFDSGLSGTVAYMSPEQARGEMVDARTDLYAFGCILYELLAGRPPFVGQTLGQVLDQHLGATPKPPSEVSDWLGQCPEAANLDELVLRLLAKEPRARFGHAADVASVLERLGAPAMLHPEAPRPRSYLYRPGFAGRTEPMLRLDEALNRLQRGTGGALLIGGESGVGKTRLLMELTRKAAGRKVRVLAGECLPGVVRSELQLASEPERGGPSGSPGLPVGVSGSESARAPRSAADRSPSLAAGSGPLEALRKPLQRLADRCRERGVEETDRLLGRRGKVLAAYEPALAGLPGQERYPEPSELPADAAKLRLFHFLAETLAALAEETEVLLVLDDLQWADELTFGFLEHWLRVQALGSRKHRAAPSNPSEPEISTSAGTHQAGAGRGAAGGPVMLVGAYRSEEVDFGPSDGMASPTSPLRRLIDSAGIESIDLRRLEAPAVASIVGDMLALEPPPPLFSRHLARHSEGNPFFVAEYLRAMVEAGADGQQPLLWRDQQGRWHVAEPSGEPTGASSTKATESDYEALPLPRTLRDLVGRRLAGLPEAALRLVEAAAILGRETELDLLERTAAKSAEAAGSAPALEAVSELLQRQVLELPQPGRIRFLHDKLREVAHDAIPAERRPGLHRAAAESMERLNSEDLTARSAALGHHWEEACEPERARPWYVAAARHAVTVYDHAEAERLYKAYLRLVEQPTAESVGMRIDMAENVLSQRGRAEEALSEHLRALDEARLARDRHNEAKALRLLGRIDADLGGTGPVQQHFEQALSIHRELGDREGEATTLFDLGNLQFERGLSELGIQHTEQALVIYREMGNLRLEGNALNALGNMHRRQGRHEQALQLVQQAHDLHRQHGFREAESGTLTNLSMQHMHGGRLEEARQLGEEALALHRQMGDLRSETITLTNLGNIHEALGDFTEAKQLYERALDFHRRAGHRRNAGIALGNLGNLHFQQGQLEPARQFHEQALAIHQEMGEPRNVGHVLGNLGDVNLNQGRPEQARQCYEQALAIHREVGIQRHEGMGLGRLANLECLAGDDPAKAAALAQKGEELLVTVGDRMQLSLLLCQVGHIGLAGGRSGRTPLERARALAAVFGAGPKSEMSRAVSKLSRAVEAFEAGEHHRLFRGHLIEDIPEGLRRWLRETGRLVGSVN